MKNHPITRFDAVAIHADAYEGYPKVQASIFETDDAGGIACLPKDIGRYCSRLGDTAAQQTIEHNPH